MASRFWFPALAATLAILAAVLPPQSRQSAPQPAAAAPSASFLVLFGIGDKTPTTWDGTLTVSGGQVLSMRGWRFTARDSTDGRSAWKAATRTSQGNSGNPGPIGENGVIVSVALTDPAALFNVHTAQGDFQFSAAETGFGAPGLYLNKRAMVERVPNTFRVTESPEEQDYPAAALSGDDLWVAYVEFVHGDRSLAAGNFDQPPASLDFLARPAGGDQVFLTRYSRSGRTWTAPVAVSNPGQDVMRAAVAVDAQKRVWVVWSAGREGNFDLYARFYSQGRFSAEQRLTADPGPDLDPVAAADAQGRVWVAWQGFRNGNLEILAAAQQDDAFTAETTVSFSPASDWDPAIAAAPNGDIAIAWDTYDKGDYDVWLRRLRWNREVIIDAPVPVAAGPNFEARASIAFDAQNRLWAAWEGSDTKWGKDFGAYETTGIALYQGHNLYAACFQGTERYRTAAALADMLPGPPSGGAFPPRMGYTGTAFQPDPGIAARRRANGGAAAPALPLNSFPRLAADPSGIIYLAYRSTTGAARSSIGTNWAESVVFFDGARWNPPVLFPETDGLLDARPALVAPAPGELLMVTATDHRQSPGAAGLRRAEPLQTDLTLGELRLDVRPQPLKLTALAPEIPAAPAADATAERDQIEAMRRIRINAGGRDLQLLRGEFHRHTEISGDGGRDGPVIDAYRYLIDAASMDWGGCCDHDNGGGREYFWWMEQKLTDAYRMAGRFVPMFSYERSVSYPEGHRNVVTARRGVRPLPRLPRMDANSPSTPAPDTQMLYRYLRQFEGIAASHTSGTDMGTDWRDNDPLLEPVVEIYQGDRQNYEMPGAPRANKEGDSIGGWRAAGFVSLALQKGYRLGFQASSDHISTHMSYCNLWVGAATREGIMEAFRQRRVYGATDNIYADVRCGDHFMGEEFAVSEPPVISVNLWGTAKFARVHVIKDGEYVYTAEPNHINAAFSWRDAAAQKGKTSYYYIRGEQVDGELVWVSPMWVRYE